MLCLALSLPAPGPSASDRPDEAHLQDSISSIRLESWRVLLAQGRQLTELERLQQVNHFVNRALSYAADEQVWQQRDYWATPAEALGRGRGDCEDYALSKYFGLLALGIAEERLRLTYVKDLRHNQAHMVLAYYPVAGGEPLLLDSLQDDIEPAARRRDLLPVYAFNGLGLYLAGKRQQTQARSADQLGFWKAVRERAYSDGSLPATLMPRS